jgi:uncharacterized protein (DUF302 family)
MTKPPGYGMVTTLKLPVETAVQQVTAVLAAQGFGILTTIDVQATLKKKLDADTRPYVILGACNPPLAHRALEAEPDIGLLLPCNVIVYASDVPGESVVSIVDPMVMATVTENPELPIIASEARERLEAALKALS